MAATAIEEAELLQKDSKYRNYNSQVEKALKSFEYTSEWADLISALGKLNKVLLGHTKYKAVPRKVTIGKRLAQCLHPALPSGVHLKALETYDIILKTIGTDKLAQDMFVYSAGLFPLLSYAAINAKPPLLALYEAHFLPLGKSLRPGLTGFLLGVLPGLEEGSDYFDRTNKLLEDVCEATDPTFFYGCMWDCVLSCPSIRLPAINYVLAHYSRKKPMEDQLMIIGTSIETMVHALCSAVRDKSVLVQRSLLEFLLVGFPMHKSELTKEDMVKVLTSAVYVVLRRDMSLNRRLYAWLLGTDSNGQPIASIPEQQAKKLQRSDSSASSETELHYYNTCSKDMLVQALKTTLHDCYDGNLKPFRILISLLDKPEIGSTILEDVLVEVFRCLYRECSSVVKSTVIGVDLYKDGSISSQNLGQKSHEIKTKHKEEKLSSELIKTSNLLFGTFEPYFMWDFIGRMFEKVCDQTHQARMSHKKSGGYSTVETTVSELCSLVDFLMEFITLETYTETQTQYLPELLGQMTTSLINYCEILTDAEITDSLHLCSKILSHVLPTMVPLMEGHHGDESLQASVEVCNSPVSQNTASCESSVGPKKFDEDSEVYESAESEIDTDPLAQSNSSNDFETKYGLAGSPFKIHFSPKKPGTKTSQASLSLMQACVQYFESFFTTYAMARILPDKQSVQNCMDLLIVMGDKNPHRRSLDVADDSALSSDESTGPEFSPKLEPFAIATKPLGKDCCMAFNTACELLMDFASFPLYCTDFHTIMDKPVTKDADIFPSWLQVLLACSCYVDNFDIQSAAISTTLDLLTLTASIIGQCEDLACKQSGSEGTVSVVIVPPLTPKVYRHVKEDTQFFEITAESLWQLLSDDSPNCHQRAVNLLYQLHQIAPTAWICEDVISGALNAENQSERIAAHKKFSILWHLTRDLKTKPGPGMLGRTFDRSMFVMLDNLQVDTSPTKSVTTDWLLHSVQRGDLSRVLEPLLLMLLHSDTARISIQHVDIAKPRKIHLSESSSDTASTGEAKIYAISSEGGNVIYHIANEGGKPISKKNVEDLRTATFTSISDRGHTMTASAGQPHLDLTFDKVDPDSLNLRVNPFGSDNSLDRAIMEGYEPPLSQFPDIKNIKRLDKETCAKEGITFDDESSDTDEEEVIENVNPEEIVKEILNDLINEALSSQPSSRYGSPDSSQSMDRKKPRTLSTFSKDSSVTCDEELLNRIESRVSEVDSSSETDSVRFALRSEETNEIPTIHPLHTHILLYLQEYDCQRTLYALTTLKSIITANPRLILCSMTTTQISKKQTPHHKQLQTLLARHRKSVFGKNFFGEVSSETASFRNSMYIEIIISVCLYYIRSYYPNLMMSKLTEKELNSNKEVQILATELLTQLLAELISVVKESGKPFASYIGDLMSRCKVQKAVLHCVLSSVYNARQKRGSPNMGNITEAIINFNDEKMDDNTNDNYQIKLLKLVQKIISLEDRIIRIKTDGSSSAGQDWDKTKVNFVPQLSSATFKPKQPIVYQGMFLSAILSALKQQHLSHMHQHWLQLVTTSLTHMGKALPRLTTSIVNQLCRNLELLASEYEVGGGEFQRSPQKPDKIPPDHVVTMLEGLTTLCHYCLIETTNQVSVGQAPASASSQTSESKASGQILNNLIHVFNPHSSREPSPMKEILPVAPVIEARRSLLSSLPKVIACLTTLWRAVGVSEHRQNSEQPCWTMGMPKVFRQFTLEFLSPISLHHGLNLLGAVAVVWNDRRKRDFNTNKKVIPSFCEDQLLLVDLVSSIKVMPTDTLIQTVKQVIKTPPPTSQDNNRKRTPLEVSMLQFFYAYVERTPSSQLLDSWQSLQSLLREGLALNLVPQGQFLLLGILNVFVQKIQLMPGRKDQKELQDLAQKLLEACSLIAGSSLEQTTWLRRNLVVKPGAQMDMDGVDENEEEIVPSGPITVQETRSRSNSNVGLSQYSVQALLMLAETIAPLLDVVYGSDEKDKVVPFLSSYIMYNVFPYLKNHSAHNMPSLRACSQVVSSLSGYQYTRKAWKKEAFDLLLDPSFFLMDITSLQHWRTIIDNLMSQDRTVFKDLMTRVAVTQTTSINLFSSHDKEFETRAQLLKRLSFVLFCSEMDQYQKFMPDIQERLAENLRQVQVPSIQAQVFLCFRVLMIRMSPQHLTSLWPTIITEMVHVFMQIEQELFTEMDDNVSQGERLSLLDNSWALGNGLNPHNQPSWLKLYLQACKLLDLALVLPADTLPQFQLYKWAFVGDAGLDEDKKIKAQQKMTQFTPHIIKLANIMNTKAKSPGPLYKRKPGCPLLTKSSVKSVLDLHAFFNTLSQPSEPSDRVPRQAATQLTQQRRLPKSKSAPEFGEASSAATTPVDVTSDIQSIQDSKQLIELILEKDFVEL